MKNLLTMLLCAATWVTYAQTKVTERTEVNGQGLLELKFDFADDILIKTWDKNEVFVEVTVSIMDGAYDHIFTLEKYVGSRSISIEMDKNMWEQIPKEERNCNINSELNYTVYMPKNMNLEANTINGSYTLETFSGEMKLKSISGDIDISVSPDTGVEFKAKSLSGEIYSDLDISFPEGKEGLHQMVGMTIRGRVYNGEIPLELETISGNIYLRRG